MNINWLLWTLGVLCATVGVSGCVFNSYPNYNETGRIKYALTAACLVLAFSFGVSACISANGFFK